ncbi:MAG: hypothetical protein GXP31_03210 [Kiritimatiellaeota bacterium]|nr:hypothetical protein [Kiritimatiellota bacterium]
MERLRIDKNLFGGAPRVKVKLIDGFLLAENGPTHRRTLVSGTRGPSSRPVSTPDAPARRERSFPFGA